MRDHDDTPTIIIERDSGGGLGAFVLGALVGAGVALLLAPQSGEETQAQLRERAGKLKDDAEDRLRAASNELEARLDAARLGVNERVDRVKGAVDAGREAAREARDELEQKLATSKKAYRAGVEAARSTVEAGAGDEDEDADDDS
ncbi:MAG: YtxH domain-containing protein [Longimicrobiales bacterium]|nr:YtxH domain-containing protein [Longimicrobiales bacterium]